MPIHGTVFEEDSPASPTAPGPSTATGSSGTTSAGPSAAEPTPALRPTPLRPVTNAPDGYPTRFYQHRSLPAEAPGLTRPPGAMENPSSPTTAPQPLVKLPGPWEDRRTWVMKELNPDQRFHQALLRP